jgi:hypothetical protein
MEGGQGVRQGIPCCPGEEVTSAHGTILNVALFIVVQHLHSCVRALRRMLFALSNLIGDESPCAETQRSRFMLLTGGIHSILLASTGSKGRSSRAVRRFRQYHHTLSVAPSLPWIAVLSSSCISCQSFSFSSIHTFYRARGYRELLSSKGGLH